MDSKEVDRQLNMNYHELVKYLLNKYGKAEHDYFCTPTCKSKNKKASRIEEGLFCHHIDEDKSILLSNDMFAAMNPYSYQKADRLVYCNILEHEILHIKIMEEFDEDVNEGMGLPGVGGASKLITSQINDYYNGYEFKQAWRKNVFCLIENNFEDYIKALKFLLNLAERHPIYRDFVSKEKVSTSWDGVIIDKIYKRL